MPETDVDPFRVVSVVIPAKNEARTIAALVAVVLEQCPDGAEVEVLVVDDDSTDDTARVASEAGAKVIRLDGSDGGNPARARNRGAAASRGNPIVFLDAGCTPHDGWLDKLLAAHEGGVEVVGGSLGLPTGLSPSARCDYYCGWYHVHPRRQAGFVKHHPPCNLSVRREAFLATRGYLELHPAAYSHEELQWQAELQSREAASISSRRPPWTTTTGQGWAIFCAATTDGAIALSRPKRRPGWPAWPGSIGTPAC